MSSRRRIPLDEMLPTRTTEATEGRRQTVLPPSAAGAGTCVADCSVPIGEDGAPKGSEQTSHATDAPITGEAQPEHRGQGGANPMNLNNVRPDVLEAACRLLMELARDEEETAAGEAAKVPYWGAWPMSITEHRGAARALRGGIDRLQRFARAVSVDPDSPCA